jgi:CubicO group peptidase (beta-lactamase class C family)
MIADITGALLTAALMTTTPMEDFLDDLAAAGQFEGVVRVESASEPVFERAYGHADVAGVQANTPDTRFHIASITKAFTATLVLHAAETGTLSLDDALVRWVPELDAAAYGDVTLRRLLEHTGGLMRDHTEALSDGEDGPEAMVRALNAVGPQSAPGERYTYSNSGYALLALVLERATGQSYARLLEDWIVRPAALSATSYGLPADTHAIAEGIDMPDLVSRVAVDVTHFRGGLPGASGIFTTAGDLVRFGQALEAGTLIAPESLDVMLAGIPAEGSDGDEAMGWMRVALGDDAMVWVASGASDGYLSMLLIDNRPDDLVAATVQNNTRAGRVGSLALLRGFLYTRVLDRPGDAAVPAAPLAETLALLDSGGIEAALRYRETLDMSDAPVASAAASQATGAPDGGVGETAFAWAPATADAGPEWLELGFGEPVTAARLDIHFTQIPDALRRVRLGADGPVLERDAARPATSETGAPVVQFDLPVGLAIDTVRIELETAQTPGWPQIDAIALTDTEGGTHWARSAEASTSAFMAGAVSMHDLPTPDILSKLALRLDETGETERAQAVRALRDAVTR